MPPAFSVVLVARNEVRSLPRALASLAPFQARGGEVLVVDTGSTDGTPDLARSGGCRVSREGARFDSTLSDEDAARIAAAFGVALDPGARLFDFGAARQAAGLLAARDLVLQIDAGDEVLALDLDSLEEAIGRGAARFTYPLHLGASRLGISRFYDRRRLGWRGRVHETLEGPAHEAEDCGAALAVRHHRNPASPRDFYLAGLALDALDHPDEPRWQHYLGRELYYRRHLRSALPLLRRHAGMPAWSAERCESLCLAGLCHEGLDEAEEAAECYRSACAVDPSRREPFLRLARLLLARGDFAGAAEASGRALEVPRTCSFHESDDNYGWLPHSLRYWSLWWTGRREEARPHWQECVRQEPGFLADRPLFEEGTAPRPGRFALACLRGASPHWRGLEVAVDAWRGGLEELGLDVVVTPDLTLPDRQYVVFGWHLLPEERVSLPPTALLYNLEQIHPGSPWLRPAALERIRTHALLDYSERNVEAWRALGFGDVAHVPLGYAESLVRLGPGPEPDVDVLFYGSLNPRRERVLEDLRRAGARVEALHGVYGADLERALARSRIVLTVHYHPTRLFDAARVLLLLANGRFVVAEDSAPCLYGEALGSGLAVHAYDDLVEACLHYLRHPDERDAVAARGWRAVRRFRQAGHLEPWVRRP